MAIRRKKSGGPVPGRLPDAKSHRAVRTLPTNRALLKPRVSQPQEQAWPQGATSTEHPEAPVAPSEDSTESPQEGRLQSRLRNNWSKLVTDKMTVMAFARSLKGHRCPAIVYCRS